MNRLLILICIFVFIATSSYAKERVWKSDPFAASNSSEQSFSGSSTSAYQETGSGSELPSLQVQGVWQVGKIYKAMISDTIITIGMKINGYLVQNIESRKIVLRSIKSGRVLTLEYNE